MSLPVHRNGPWAHVLTPADDFNWKLHLSSTQAQALSLLDTVVPILMEYAVPFKVAMDSDVLAGLNEGVFGATQVGKFITIYPPIPDDGLCLAERLAIVTQGFSGPRVVTDLRVGPVVYVRYGSHSPPMKRDRLGNLSAADERGNGGYRIPFVPPEGVENPYRPFMGADDPARRGLSVIGPGYVLLKPLSIHAKGTVFLAFDVRRQDAVRTVVVKEGRRHCLSDAHGRDISDRLRHQERIHKEVAEFVRVPPAGDLFEVGENLYLPLEYVEGSDLTDRVPAPFRSLPHPARREVLQRFRALSSTLAQLHSQGYVHRDLSPRNVRITPRGEVYLLDLEIAHRVGNNDIAPFQQGTVGFVSPQQSAGGVPAFTDDIFSFGCLLVYVITGLDPRRIDLGTPETLCQRLDRLSGAPKDLLELCCGCLDPVPRRRPLLDGVAHALERSMAGRERDRLLGRPADRHEEYASALARKTALDALEWMVHGSPRDEQSLLWTSPEITASVHESPLQSPHAYRLYRSINRGVAGVVYTIAHAHLLGLRVSGAERQVSHAVDWLLAHAPTPDDQMPGLHFGEAGVAVAIAESVKAGLIEPGPWLRPYLHEALSGPLDWPDLTHGAAGQGLAAVLCGQALDDPALSDHAHRCAGHLLRTQRADGSWCLPEGVPTMEGVVYTGFAHGVAGIVYFLAVHARVFGTDASGRAAVRGGRWLITQMRRGGNGAAWWPMQIGKEEAWSWWCHGGPGIALAFLELYRVTGEADFAESGRAAICAHARDERHPNLSQCHGLAGYGEALLTAHDVLGDRDLLDRALCVAADLVALRHQHSRGVAWLVENPYHATADLMIGCGGVAHFLARLSRWRDQRSGMPLAP